MMNGVREKAEKIKSATLWCSSPLDGVQFSRLHHISRYIPQKMAQKIDMTFLPGPIELKQNWKHVFWPTYEVWSFFGKTTLWPAEFLQQPIESFYFMVFMLLLTLAEIRHYWKAMKNWVRNCFHAYHFVIGHLVIWKVVKFNVLCIPTCLSS